MRLSTYYKRSSGLKHLALGLVVTAMLGVAGVLASQGAGAQNVAFSSAVDCDSNAVITGGALSVNALVSKYDSGSSCGGNNSSATDIHNVFSHFGISSSEVHSMATSSTTVIAGKVDKAGNVYDDNGTVVATNALTAGMENIAGSTTVTSNGTTFYTRAPAVSFQSNTLDAYVVMVNNQFSYAVIASCGNPVKATPKAPATPDYTITKEVTKQGQAAYSKDLTVAPDTEVRYRVTVKSTGTAPAQNVAVKDVLPPHVTYVPGSFQVDGIDSTASNAFFGSGYTIPTLNGTVTFTFDAVVGKGQTTTTCTAGTFTNTASMTGTGLPGKDDSADVTETCKPPTPTFACTSLTSFQNNRTTYTFTAVASADNGAVITGYEFNFGDGSTKRTVTTSAKTTSTTYEYAKAGTYHVTMAALVSVNGAAAKAVSGDKCATSVTVKEAPAAECTGLKLDVDKATRTVTATTSVFTKNGATLKTVSYNFDDGTTAVMRNDLNAVSHQYKADGNYTVKATVSFNNAGNTPDSVCQAPVSFTTPTTPAATTLPNTGAGSTVALFAVVSAGGVLAHRMFLKRRLN